MVRGMRLVSPRVENVTISITSNYFKIKITKGALSL